MKRSTPNPDHYLILLWAGFAFFVSLVIAGCLGMVASIWFGQYLWLIPIAIMLLWVVHQAESCLHHWARWVERRFLAAEQERGRER